MKTIPFILILSLLLTLASFRLAYSQEEEIEGYDSIADRVLLKKELTGGITLHNLGMGGNFRRGVNKTYFNSRILELEAVSMKHPKQVVFLVYSPEAKNFVYGKLNHVHILRTGYGFKKLLNRKPYWGGIELRFLYLGGVSLAFAKPVYLVIYDPANPRINRVERYNPDNPNHNLDNIIGRAAFFEGIEETRIHPGVYLKAGLNFEFGKLNSKIRSLEAGAVGEFFPVEIPIMAFNPAQNFFITFYLNFSLGKRYN